ncbi:hypothetical protein BU16DRAFT_560188 [Lophium mytilinum]|uniref:Transmembrane protein n=1 Tax=Lophium mytilinum TaxID=390894 RepID=A0A6A6QXF4_9PEZI|nr:hypothetical protein BU16DRAFT_560188 [Lophium mytilinum]
MEKLPSTNDSRILRIPTTRMLRSISLAILLISAALVFYSYAVLLPLPASDLPAVSATTNATLVLPQLAPDYVPQAKETPAMSGGESMARRPMPSLGMVGVATMGGEEL